MARRRSARSSTTSSRAATSTSSPSRITNGSMRPSPPGPSRRTAACRSRSSSARKSRPSAVTCSPCTSRPGSRPYRSMRDTVAAVHDAGGLAIPAHPLVPVPAVRPGVGPAPAHRRPGRTVPPGRGRDVQPDGPRPTLACASRPVRGSTRPRPRRQQRRPCARGHRDGLDQLPGAGPPPISGRRSPGGATEHHGSFHGTAGQLGTFGRQLSKRGRDARDELAGRLRQDGTGRDHGYPGGRRRPPRHEPSDRPSAPVDASGASDARTPAPDTSKP